MAMCGCSYQCDEMIQEGGAPLQSRKRGQKCGHSTMLGLLPILRVHQYDATLSQPFLTAHHLIPKKGNVGYNTNQMTWKRQILIGHQLT